MSFSMSGTIYSTGDSQRSTRVPMRRRLGLVIGAAIALLVFAVVGVNSWMKLGRVQAQLKAADPQGLTVATDVLARIERMNAALLRFKLSNRLEDQQFFEREAKAVREMLAVAEGAGKVREPFAKYLAEGSALVNQPFGAVRKDSAARLQEQIDYLSAPVLAAVNDWTREQNAALSGMFTTSAQAALTGRRLLEAVVLLLIGLIVAGMILAYVPVRHGIRESQATLERQEKLASLGTLATGIAHEIRNPLAAIKFRLFSLKKALPGPLTTNEDLVVIKTEIDRLEQLVKDFLHFARPAEPKMGNVNAKGLLGDVRVLLQPQLEKVNIRLEAEAAEDLFLNADREQLEQVLINLVQNAADSIGQEGTVTLKARQGLSKVNRQATPLVILEVSDTGQGIPPEVEGRIFDPFFSTKDTGTGLGLSIAARIIEKHGGFMQYQSQVNRGTTFSIVLPRHESHVTHPAN